MLPPTHIGEFTDTPGTEHPPIFTIVGVDPDTAHPVPSSNIFVLLSTSNVLPERFPVPIR